MLDATRFIIHNGQSQDYMSFFNTDGSNTTVWGIFDINKNGKIKIETTVVSLSGKYNLYVSKGILTEKIKVALATGNDWSDYVFASNYNLLPLMEVETFVKKDKHLPNVPSADELVKSGIDLAKMDAKLLEKIEELTLYMIELEKENKKLADKIEMLELKVN